MSPRSTLASPRRRVLLPLLVVAGLSLAPPSAAQADRTEVVSRGDSRMAARGSFGNADSTAPAMSADGRYVTFLSQAGNLVARSSTTPLTAINAFRRDLTTGEVDLVSQACPTETYCSTSSVGILAPAISADGRYVTFMTAAQILPGDTSPSYAIYRRDVASGTTERVTDVGEADVSNQRTATSSDGRWVAYTTRLLPDGTTAEREQLILRDMTLEHDAPGARRLVSHTPDGGPGDGTSAVPSFSTDGSTLVFASQAANLDDRSDEALDSVFAASLPDLELERLSVADDGTPVKAPVVRTVASQHVSANGRRVLIASADPRLKPEGVEGLDPSSVQLYVRDRDRGTVQPASVDPSTGRWAKTASFAALSADGRSVAFHADSAFAALPEETAPRVAVFVRRLDGGPLERVSLGADGAIADDRADMAQISADGRYVAFQSKATNLLTSGSFNSQVFRRDTQEPTNAQEPPVAGGDGGATTRPLVTTTSVIPPVPGTTGRDATLQRGRLDLTRTSRSAVGKRLRRARITVDGTRGTSTKNGRSRLTVTSGSILRAAEARTRGTLRFRQRSGGRLRTVTLTDLRATASATSVRVTAKYGGRRLTVFTVPKVSGLVVDPVGGRAAVRTGTLRMSNDLARTLRSRLRASGLRAGTYGRFALNARGTPSVAGTPAIPGWTSSVTAPGPAPAPTTPSTPGAEEPINAVGTTRWAFQESFRRYVGNGDGKPPLQATDGATNDVAGETFVFSTTDGSYDVSAGTGRVVNRGRIVFDYPGHFFRITIADPTLVIEGTTGYLEGFAQADLYGVAGEGKRVRLADLDLTGATREVVGRKVSISGIAATLTAEAAPLFGGFWAPGQVLAPLSFSADIG